MNKNLIIGYLAKDPEIKKTASGLTIAELTIPTTEKWKDKQGQPQERTEWHSVVFMGRTAEICEQYLNKGSQVYIEGQLETQSWEHEGVKKYKTVTKGRELKMLGGGQKGGNSQGSSNTNLTDDLPF